MRILLLLLVATSVASADNRSDADAYARRGVALYNLGKYDDAIVAFEQAYTLFQSDALLFNLAQAHRQLEHCELALHYYRRFMDGEPAPALAAQVVTLLPKLEAACKTKFERPKGPASATPTDDAPKPQVAAAKEPEPQESDQSERVDEDAHVTQTITPSRSAVAVSGSLLAGTVIAGRVAPTAGLKLAVTTTPAVLRGSEVGGAVSVGRMWRGDANHDAMLASLTAIIRYRADFAWGRFTIGGELGAALFSSLDTSSGVVPGVTRAGQWAPHARAEIGAEHDVAHSLALRFGVAVGVCPRVGGMLTAAGQLDLLLGLRYAR